MFKLVVLCVFAAAVAEPEPGSLLYGSSLTYSSYPGVVPATTIAQPSWIAQSSPLIYSSPYAYSHLIKKRSADPEPEPEAKPEASPEANPEAKPDPQLLTYGSSLYNPYTYSSPAFNPFIGYSGFPSTYPLATHLIKKRSAQFLTPSTYVPTTYSVPTYNSYLPTTAYLGSSYPGAVDVVLNQHLIKKRSAQLSLATPWAGASYSAIPSLYNSYIPSVPTTYLGSNVYNYPGVVGLHSIKKRSAQLLAAPAYLGNSVYSAASPIYSSTYTASSPYISTLPYVASPYSYSTYIKK